MSFESGKIGVRAFYLIKAMPEDLQESMRKKPVPPEETVMELAFAGWVVQEELAGYKRAILRTVQRKISTVQLKKEVAAECKAWSNANPDVHFMPKKVKSEIAEGCRARLLPNTPVTERDISLVWRQGSDIIYTMALSGGQQDLLAIHMSLLQCPIVSASPESCAMRRLNLDYRNLKNPASFSEAMDPACLSHGIGAEFLTWLWYRFERGGTTCGVGILLEGPLTLTREVAASETTTLKGGTPTRSPEAGSCLKDGKVLVKAKFTFGESNLQYGAVVDQGFGFRGLTLPPAEGKLDFASSFQERVTQMEKWFDIFLGLFDKFCEHRFDAEVWILENNMAKQWVSEKKAEG